MNDTRQPGQTWKAARTVFFGFRYLICIGILFLALALLYAFFYGEASQGVLVMQSGQEVRGFYGPLAHLVLDVEKTPRPGVSVDAVPQTRFGYGFGTGRGTDNQVTVLFVASGSASDDVGIRVGDQILSVDGTPVSQMSGQQFNDLIDSQDSTTLAFTHKGTTTSQTVSMSKSSYVLSNAALGVSRPIDVVTSEDPAQISAALENGQLYEYDVRFAYRAVPMTAFGWVVLEVLASLPLFVLVTVTHRMYASHPRMYRFLVALTVFLLSVGIMILGTLVPVLDVFLRIWREKLSFCGGFLCIPIDIFLLDVGILVILFLANRNLVHSFLRRWPQRITR